MGLLDGAIRDLFSSAFGGLYLDGTLHSGTRKPTYEGGRVTGYVDTGDEPLKVQTDTTSDQLKASDGYAVGDAMLIILSRTPATAETPAVDITISTDSEVTDGFGDRYRIQDTDQDPARSHWICHARPI